MRRILGLLAAGGAALLASPASPAPLAGQDSGVMVEKRESVPYDQRHHLCWGGVVTAVTDRSITVERAFIIDGTKNPPQVFLPSNTFSVSKELAGGGTGQGAIGAYAYRLADVRVGDKVDVEYDRMSGAYICTAISIQRRPGGRVPPSQNHSAHPTVPLWHEKANALQDSEESGIPLPAKFVTRPPDLEAPKRPKDSPAKQ